MKKKDNSLKSKIELLDSFLPIICICWVLVFAYISYFTESKVMAFITVVPLFFLYSLYLIISAVCCYKEKEILEALGKDTYEVEKRNRKNKPILSKAKFIAAGCCFIVGVLICIIL